MSSSPGRRLLRFSLRSMLVLMFVLCLALAAIVKQANDQRAAVAWVREMGGRVVYASRFGLGDPTYAHYGDDGQLINDVNEWGPNWLHEGLPVHYRHAVTVVILENDRVTDISPLANFTRLSMLKLDAPISDVSPLARLTNLKYLHLRNTQVDDVSSLTGLINLEELHLFRSEVSNISPVRNLTKLRFLRLVSTPVSDLSPVANLPKLRLLSLYDMPVTDEEVLKLQQALPFCKIRYAR